MQVNHTYPKELRHTFEAFQKLFLELDVCKFPPKLLTLKNKLVTSIETMHYDQGKV